MPGYSGTPLIGKLGFKPGTRVLTIGAPRDYRAWLGELPAGTRLVTRSAGTPAAVHLFATARSDLARELAALRQVLASDGFVWVSWPKKASKVPTDITEDAIRAIALPMGFVDIKVCAVSEIWSGLKLVIRRSERPKHS